MRVKDLFEIEALQEVVPHYDPDTEITGPYCCDLLSVAMRDAPDGGAWCTVMNNVNTLAVAALTETACVILCGGIPVNPDVLNKAQEQEICLFTTELNEFEAALAVYKSINGIS